MNGSALNATSSMSNSVRSIDKFNSGARDKNASTCEFMRDAEVCVTENKGSAKATRQSQWSFIMRQNFCARVYVFKTKLLLLKP